MKRGELNPAAYVTAAEAASYAAWGVCKLDSEISYFLRTLQDKDPYSRCYEEAVSSLGRALRLLTERGRKGKITLRGKKANKEHLDWEQIPVEIDPVELAAFRCIDWSNRVVWDPGAPMSKWSHLPSLVSWFDLTLSRADAINMARLFDAPDAPAAPPPSPRDVVPQEEVDEWMKDAAETWPAAKPWPPETELLSAAQAFFQPRHVGRRSIRTAAPLRPAHARKRGRPPRILPEN